MRTGITSPFLNLQNHSTLYFNSSYLFCFLSSLFLFRCQVGTIGQSSDTYQFSSLQLQYQADYSPTFFVCLYGKVQQNFTFFWLKYFYRFMFMQFISSLKSPIFLKFSMNYPGYLFMPGFFVPVLHQLKTFWF